MTPFSAMRLRQPTVGSGLASIAYGTFTGPGSTGTQDINCGGTPGMVMIWGNRRTSAGAGDDHARMCFGVAIPSGNKWSMATFATDGVSPSATRRIFRSDYVLCGLSDASDAQEGLIDTLTGLSNGFQINWTVGSTGIYHYVAFPLAMSVHVGTFDSGTSTGNVDVTAPGFLPAMTGFGTSIENTTEGALAGGSFSLGFGTSSSNRVGGNWYDRDNVATTRAKGQVTASNVIVQTDGTSNAMAMDYSGTVTGGFRVNIGTAPASSTRIGYFCLGGSGFSANVGTFTTKTTNTSQAYTGVGFQPDTILFFGRGPTALDTLQGASQCSIGAAKSSSNRGYAGYGSNDGGGADCARVLKTDKAFGVIAGTSASASYEADFTSMDADGWTFIWSSTGAAATYCGRVAMAYSP